jgi:hypothetical protein
MDEINIANKNALQQYRESEVVKQVEVLATNSSCRFCKILEGKKYSLPEAEGLLPVKECTHKLGCRCTFIPIV